MISENLDKSVKTLHQATGVPKWGNRVRQGAKTSDLLHNPLAHHEIVWTYRKQQFPSQPQIPRLVHSDVHGPLKMATPQGFKYWITFIDNKSCFICIYLSHNPVLDSGPMNHIPMIILLGSDLRG